MLYQPVAVFTSRCCKLVNDNILIPFGSTSRRHRLPKLYAIALSHIHEFFKS
jgi:hypothetical protein